MFQNKVYDNSLISRKKSTPECPCKTCILLCMCKHKLYGKNSTTVYLFHRLVSECSILHKYLDAISVSLPVNRIFYDHRSDKYKKLLKTFGFGK